LVQSIQTSNHWEQYATDLKFDESSGQLLFGRIPEQRYLATSDFPRWFAQVSMLMLSTPILRLWILTR